MLILKKLGGYKQLKTYTFPYSRHQKVQRISRRRPNCQENDKKRSQNAECTQGQVCCQDD